MRLLLALICCTITLVSFSGETPIPAAPTGWVTDTAGFMSATAAQALNLRLQSYEQTSGRQVFVYIGKTTGGVPIEDWAVKAFKTWKVGRKGKDDGVVLFIMTDDRRMRIEVGYGLEGQLTDALSSRIIHDTMQPKLQANDADGAVTSGVEEIVKVLDGKALPGAASGTSPPGAAGQQQQPQPLSGTQKVIYGIIALIFLVLFITHPSMAMYLLINILSNGRGGYGGGGRSSGGSSGGGFGGGGGGRSGGGGASGSW